MQSLEIISIEICLYIIVCVLANCLYNVWHWILMGFSLSFVAHNFQLKLHHGNAVRFQFAAQRYDQTLHILRAPRLGLAAHRG